MHDHESSSPRKRIVFLTGAGVSAESGLATFRGMNGLWENHRVEEVASPEAWHRNPELVLRFYNERRRQVLAAEPNAAHRAMAHLEQFHDVTVITQNVDDLHERAGSTDILHLHGEIRKSRSTRNPNLVYAIEGTELAIGDRCELGSQLRPHIVWFGEPVPMIERAIEIIPTADRLIIVGTSLQVYPAAGLVDYASPSCEVFYIDPSPTSLTSPNRWTHIQDTACNALPTLVENWCEPAS